MSSHALSRRSLLSLLGLSALSRSARAQPPASPTQNPPAPKPPRTFTDGLQNLYWPPETRGALLVLIPSSSERGLRRRNGSATPALPLTPGPGGYRLVDLAAAFDRLVTPFGSVTAAIPSTMRVVRAPAGIGPDYIPPEFDLDIVRDLYESLTPAQWKMVGGATGLAGSDLSGPQRALFLTLLPDPVILRPTKAPMGIEEPPGTLRIAGDNRLKLRIHMHRSIEMAYMAAGTDGGNSASPGGAPGGNAPDYVLVRGSGFRPEASNLMMPTLPNRPKPSDLDTRRLDAPISLTGGTTWRAPNGVMSFRVGDTAPTAPVAGEWVIEDVLTVDEIVKRCAKATGLELYADARYGALPMLVRGESARAGDILDALTRSLTGTFRKLSDNRSSVFILTDDRDGLGPRLATIANLQVGAAIARFKRREAAAKAHRAAPERDNPLSLIPYTDTSDFPPELLRQIEKQALSSGKPKTPGGFAIGDLPPNLQARARERLAKNPIGRVYENDNWADRALRTDRVLLLTRTETRLVLPDGSTSQFGSLSMVPPWMDDDMPVAPTPASTLFSWPDAWKERVALLDGADSSALPELIAAAKKAGATLAVVDVPNDPGSSAVLKAAIAAGKLSQLPIGAAIRLLTVPKTTIPSGATPDRNARGETSDVAAGRLLALRKTDEFAPDGGPPNWIRLTPTAIDERVETFARLAATPGLASVVVRDGFPAGYAGEDFGNSVGGDLELRLGFTLANRIAFVRSNHVDPIDLPPTNFYDGRLELPYFRTQNMTQGMVRRADDPAPPPNPLRHWNRLRASEMAPLRSVLHSRLHSDGAAWPLWLEGPSDLSVWVHWEKPDMAPSPTRIGDASRVVTAHRFGPIVLATISTDMFKDKNELDAALSTMRTQEAAPGALTWDGVVFDVSRLDKVTALSTLAALPR